MQGRKEADNITRCELECEIVGEYLKCLVRTGLLASKKENPKAVEREDSDMPTTVLKYE